jgi:hypothetical protein
MRIDLHLPDLPVPRLTEALLRGPSRILQDVSRRNRARFEQGTETKQFKNRKEELIRRLQHRATTGESFEQASDVVGRERLLLSLYLEYLGRADATWLPAFDNKRAIDLLGNSGADWHPGRQRQVTLLFFTHFDKLTALQLLCVLLNRAYASNELGGYGDVRVQRWREQRKTIFDLAGPEKIARQTTGAETLPEVMERFGVPNNGRFAEKLRQVFLLHGIKVAPLGRETSVFAEVEKLKNERASGNLLMGAAALKIMVQRVAAEGGRKWSDDWSRWIIRFGCDPRYGRASAENAKWWGWATDAEIHLAQQGITGLTLRFFINFLRNSLSGTGKEEQFALRSRFLLALFDAGKIRNARLVLNRSAIQQLAPKYRDPGTVALLLGTTDQTSMVCLNCADDIFIIEGTHTFGLRMFHRIFPIDGFWDHPRKTYQDRHLRISPADCPVFLRHSHSGNWVNKFFYELRTKFHIEWDDVRI